MKEGWKVLESKQFLIPSLPPSVNSIYQIIFAQRRVEMKPDVRLWKSKVKEYVPRIIPLHESHFFKLDVTYYYNFFYKNGKLKKFDSQNLMKVLCDAVAEKCGFPDELIKFGSWESYHSPDREYGECKLSQLKSPSPETTLQVREIQCQKN